MFRGFFYDIIDITRRTFYYGKKKICTLNTNEGKRDIIY